MREYQIIDGVLEEMKQQSMLKDRNIVLLDDFTMESCYKIQYSIQKIVRMDDIEGKPIKDRKPITININSNGGDVFACFGLISYIERLKEQGYKINTYINTIALSCGFLLAIVGSHRAMNRRAVALMHQMSTGARGTVQDIFESVDFDREYWDRNKKYILQYTNFTEEELDEMQKRKLDKWMFAEEMLEKGCIDEII